MRFRRSRSAIACALAAAAVNWRKAGQELEVEMLRNGSLVTVLPVLEDGS